MSDMPDLSALFEMLNSKGINGSELMKNLSNNSSNCDSNNSTQNSCDNSSTYSGNTVSTPSGSFSSNDGGMPDMETMMKIAKIMKAMNSNNNNPSTDLLYSLKPFLRDSKKEKVDQYIKFLKMSSIISEINKPGGDLK